ncbi:hypothetical protein GCM10012287_53570 [Streptomyces daqingensis]|uniref:Uncharacterized protein n=1 Tax=Streptomyces daqingensis TaxID=1472640 RepID=A0ABQ2MT73_9ACTN|nr:hypothetical protein GCM10012287_53570 [Streptomyces daqingensis]
MDLLLEPAVDAVQVRLLPADLPLTGTVVLRSQRRGPLLLVKAPCLHRAAVNRTRPAACGALAATPARPRIRPGRTPEE